MYLHQMLNECSHVSRREYAIRTLQRGLGFFGGFGSGAHFVFFQLFLHRRDPAVLFGFLKHYTAGMNQPNALLRRRRLGFIVIVVLSLLLSAKYFYVYGQDKSGFPDGLDAVQAAPNSHKVIFENEFVRVLEVTMPNSGNTEPMHHHRWPSFFLDWDTGGGSPHIRYHRPDGSVRDSPSTEEPVHPGAWSVHWMKPEPMHSIEVVEMPKSAIPLPGAPTSLRIEIKCHP